MLDHLQTIQETHPTIILAYHLKPYLFQRQVVRVDQILPVALVVREQVEHRKELEERVLMLGRMRRSMRLMVVLGQTAVQAEAQAGQVGDRAVTAVLVMLQIFRVVVVLADQIWITAPAETPLAVLDIKQAAMAEIPSMPVTHNPV